MEYRELAKVHGTYAKPYIAITSDMHKNGEECVIHTDFKQIGASSGRFSSLNPNMQNLPQKGEGEKMRNVFVARKGFKLVSADYSQIEFRVMADISEDSALLVDFNAQKDIHSATAARILNKKLEEVTKQERYLGKTMNFSILFGQTPYGLSRLLGVDSKLSAQYIDEYFKNYKGVKEYIDEAKETALEKGYVQTMLGRTRYITGLSSRNFNVKAAAVREAINMPIQGGEADIMKLAMIDLDRMIEKKYKDEAFMLLQIHDELVFEVKKDKVEKFEKDVAKIMRDVVKMKVPLDVNTGSGDNLAQLK
jgi:DNA polymerase-1